MTTDNGQPTSRDWYILPLALAYPSLLTLVYFVWLAGSNSAAQQLAYGVGKSLQFLLPLVWVGLICRQPLGWPRFSKRGLAAGILFGLAVAAAMLVVYFGWLKSSGLLGGAAVHIQERMDKIGIRGGLAFAGLAVFYCLLHSLAEEYYWRWFVFGRLRRVVALPVAIAVSSIGFMAHHVIVVGWYFGWASLWTWALSLSTAVGGAYWAWLYHKSNSIYAPWASHLLIDAGIVVIGYDLIGRSGFPA